MTVTMAVACGVRHHMLMPLSRGFALPQFQPSLKVLSWNVAGLRSMLKRDDGAELFAVVKDEQPDIIILQEHKLQDVHVPKHEPSVLRIFDEACPGKRPYRATWAVSSQRKGYSGTCAIYHSDAGGGVLGVTTGGVDKVDQSEGRSVCLNLGCGLRVVGVYVPNSGQNLSRLDYRVKEWDRNLQSYMAEGTGSGVLLCGDLNVAHEDIDIWNAATPRIRKQAGTTPQERESFSRFLSELDMVDAFRWRYPDVPDAYTFWSRRLRHREVNKGLRLDYFLVSRALAKGTSQATLDDCRILDGYGGSAVYAKWNAEKFSDVPRLMDKYKDQEDEIYDRIVRKYVFCRSQKDWQPLIEAMYRRFNPSKLQELDSIFAKYKDSEAALYRALCDKYLQTLSPDGEPLKFNVWELGTDPVEVGEASELEVLDSPQEEAPPIRLVSPSPSQPEDNDRENNGAEDPKKDREQSEARTSPHEEQDARAEQPGAAEELLAASLAALDAEGKEEKKKKKKRRDGEAFPPPLPRPPRESMAGVSDFPDVILGLTQAPAEKLPDKSRRASNSLRPKAAPRPPLTQPQEAGSGQPVPPLDPVLGTTRKVRRKRAENGENVEASAPEGRRKKRRKVASSRPGNATVSQTAPALPPPTLEQRRLQLKEKLFELKTQISTQAVPKHGPPMPLPRPAEDFWGQPMKASHGSAFEPDADSYSYSEDDADWCAERQAESRTVVLRNKLEAQLRAKLMHTIHPKVPEAA
ncbi:ARP [Symbiodinium microadriaticum]|nr:ARP [Symbiodinium microadriaticum]